MQIILKIKNYLLYEKSGSDDQMRALVVFLVILVEASPFLCFIFILKRVALQNIQKTFIVRKIVSTKHTNFNN